MKMLKNSVLLIGLLLFFAAFTSACTNDDDAATPSKSFRTGKNSVVFQSEGVRLTGNLYLPAGFDQNKKYPAVIFDGPQSGLKDQVAGLYAQKIADAGYITLAYDHRFYGESEGEPRQLEAPSEKVKDNKNALTYLRTLSFVDADNIAGIGICAGGGIMSKTVAEDKRFKTVIGIAAAYNDSTQYKNWFGGTENLRNFIANAAGLRQKYETTGQVEYIASVSNDPNVQAAMPTLESTNEPYAYYGTQRGHSPFYVNRMAVQSYEDILQFDVMGSASRVSVPALIIHGTTDVYCSPAAAEKFYQGIPAEKELFWIKTTNHIDLYDQEAYVNQAASKAVSWLQSHLR